MSAVCSLCRNVYRTSGPCPRCGAHSPLRDGGSPGGPGGPWWLHTMAGRLFIGLIVSQGLFYGLERLLTGVLLAVQGGTAEELWLHFPNVVALIAAQVVAVLCGALLAGVGQEGAASIGAIAGAWYGVMAIVLRQVPPDSLNNVALYASPLAFAGIGAVGASIGAWIWRPLPADPSPVMLTPRKKQSSSKKSPFSGPIAWIRVALGTALAVAGTLSAAGVYQRLMDLSGGRLSSTGTLQDQIIIWEIQGLALLLGGAFAGAVTSNGPKQGLAVAIASSILLVGVQSFKSANWLEPAFYLVVATFALALAGGWFGGALFPPVVRRSRRGDAHLSAQA